MRCITDLQMYLGFNVIVKECMLAKFTCKDLMR